MALQTERLWNCHDRIRSAQPFKEAFNVAVISTEIYLVAQSRHWSLQKAATSCAWLARQARPKIASGHAGPEVVIRHGPLPLRGTNRLSVVLKSWTLSSLVNYVFPLTACSWSNRLLMLASTFLERQKSWEIFRVWMVAWLFEISRYEIFALFVCSTNGLSAEKRRHPSELQLFNFRKTRTTFTT